MPFGRVSRDEAGSFHRGNMPSLDDILPSGLDLEILSRDIQAISSADAVAAFFARLGYNTNARLKQTPANLGMAAEGTSRPIRNVELIADHEGFLQVYLFELTSVTVTHTRALARAFKNRVGDQLLVLTSDYETLDFVLLEKYLPADESGAIPMRSEEVSRRPDADQRHRLRRRRQPRFIERSDFQSRRAPDLRAKARPRRM